MNPVVFQFVLGFLFSVRLLSVLRGHSVFSSTPQRPMTSDFKGFSIPDFIHYNYFPVLILENESVFPFSMLSAKQGNHWYHFYNVFGMTRSLTGDCTRDCPHSKPALYHQAIEEAVTNSVYIPISLCRSKIVFPPIKRSQRYVHVDIENQSNN